MEVLIGGAALVAVAGKLLIEVLHAKEKASSFRSMFECLQSTLTFITHFLDEISGLNNNLEILMLLRKMHINLWGEATDSVYQRKAGKKLFLLKGYAYDIDLGDLNPFHLLNKGTSVTSYMCNAQHRDVYVKSINLEVPVRENEFQQRMEGIGKVGQHPNIMLPFGYLFSETARYLFYDYAPASSLYALLKEPKSLRTRPHWDRSLKIVLGAARGISHIHSQGGIIHGNIKSSNVLVTADYDGCISDFGLAPMMNIPALTPELSAPEFKETGEATQKSDVYNFGLILSEITFCNMRLLLHLLSHPSVAKEEGQILLISGKCRQRDPNRRPTMDEVVRLIQNIQPSQYGKWNAVVQVARNLFMKLFGP